MLICNSQALFEYGGAEILVDSLRAQLAARGFEVDVVQLPFQWPTRVDLLKSALAWRMLDLRAAEGLRRIDLVIATRFPSYLVAHPNKVVWLVHQLRQAYELVGTQHSDFHPEQPRDRRALAMIQEMDRRTLAEARAVFAISRNVADRLQRQNQVAARVLYPPSQLSGRLHEGEFGDYVFSIGRLNPMKRFDLLVRALAHTATPVRVRIAGGGDQREPLLQLAARLGVGERLELLGRVEDEAVPALYAGSLGVFYAPFDEDYGFVTAEAFEAGKPVLTAADAGGVLELVEDGVNGFVAPADSPRAIAAAMDRLWHHRDQARRLGAAGRAKAAAITWDAVIAQLTA